MLWGDRIIELNGPKFFDPKHMQCIFRCASISCTDHRDWLTDWLTDRNWRLAYGHFSSLINSSVTTCLVLLACKYHVWSPRPDQTRPDQTRVSNYKMYFCQILKCICLKLQIIFVSISKMYLSQIAKCICLFIQYR